MKILNHPRASRPILSLVALLASSGLSLAGSAAYDFNGSGIQAGDSLLGSAAITNNELELTTATNSQTGSLTVRDLDPGQQLTSFSANFSILMGGSTSGTAADGIGFSVGQALLGSAYGEGGTRSGLTISFDTFDQPGGLDIRYYGRTVYEVPGLQDPATLLTNTYVPVSVTFNQAQDP